MKKTEKRKKKWQQKRKNRKVSHISEQPGELFIRIFQIFKIFIAKNYKMSVCELTWLS